MLLTEKKLKFVAQCYTIILTFNNELNGHCVKAGFRPIFRIITEQNDAVAIANHVRTQSYMRKFGYGVLRFIQDRS